MKTAPLGEVATIERRGMDPSALAPDVRYLGLEHIERGGRIIGSDTVGQAKLASTKFAFTSEHVLYGKLRPNLGKVSRPAFAGVCSTDILPIRPGPLLDRDYLAHYLSQPAMVDFAASRTSGANLPRLSPTVLGTFEIPLPPIDEQRRIAAVLDHGDALRVKQRRVITKLDALIQAVFTATFWTGVASTRWPTVRFGDVVPTIDSGSSPICEARKASDGEWGVLKLGAISYGVFKPEENKAFLGDPASIRRVEVEPGDLLFSRKNTKELVGATAVAYWPPPRLLLPDLIFRLNIDRNRVDAEYLHALLRDPRMRPSVVALASGSASSMSNISKARLVELRIELPPIELQRAYSERVRRVDGLRRECHAAASDLDALFASLQYRAFSGQL